ncbi:MAG: ABC transporter permease, partial [Clostridiales bacterium]|nr:ABC transporter permease [Clostridiales bacterium]
KINIGDKIALDKKEFKVVGFVSIPDYIYPTKSMTDLMVDPNKFGVGVVTTNEIDKFSNSLYFYSIKGDYKSAKDYIDKNYKILMWQDIKDNLRYTLAKKKIEQLPSISQKIPLLFFTLTFILLFVLIRRIIKLETKEIGTLYALGYTKQEIQKHYLSYPIIIAILGTILGLIFTLMLSKPLTDYYVFYFNIPVESTINYKYITIGLIESLVILSLATYTSSKNILKSSPTTLLRGKSNYDKMTRLNKINLSKLKFKQKFRIRESIRGLSKTILLTFGIFTASTMLLVGFAAKGSVDALINKVIKETLNYKYSYVFKENYNKNDFNQEGFKVAYFEDKTTKEKIIVYGLEENTKSIKLVKGKKEVAVDKIYITTSLYEKLNNPSTLKLINLLNNKEIEINIQDTVDVYTGNVIYMPINKLNELLNDEINTINGVYSDTKLDISEDKILKYESIDETLKSFDVALEPVKYMLIFMGILSFIVALIVVYIVTSLIIEENKPTISMLKILGYQDGEINSLVLSFMLLPSIIGYILAIPLVKGFLNSILKTSLKDVNLALPIVISPIYSVLGFAIIYFVLIISKFISKHKIYKISMVDALKLQRE